MEPLRLLRRKTSSSVVEVVAGPGPEDAAAVEGEAIRIQYEHHTDKIQITVESSVITNYQSDIYNLFYHDSLTLT